MSSSLLAQRVVHPARLGLGQLHAVPVAALGEHRELGVALVHAHDREAVAGA
jgi:hypothetical protein